MKGINRRLKSQKTDLELLKNLTTYEIQQEKKNVVKNLIPFVFKANY